MKNKDIIIGYYPIRGKVQVCRLLCEYLKVDYKDKLYSIADWEREKKLKSKTSGLMELPHLKEGNFHLSGSIPMCLYIIERFSNGDLLGKNLKDQALIDMYIWTIDAMSKVININCQKKSQKEIEAFKEIQWKNVVLPKLSKYEEFCQPNNWFLGYLTIIDFSIYELMRYMYLIFGEKSNSLPKLKSVEAMISDLPAIKEYEESERAIREMCPTSLLKQIREQIKGDEVGKESEKKETGALAKEKSC